jgi:hypothetical protein
MSRQPAAGTSQSARRPAPARCLLPGGCLPAVRRLLPAACCLLPLALFVAPASAQQVAQRGFVEARATAYPQDTPFDSTNLVGNFLFRDEVSWRPSGWLTLAAAFDAQMDTHGRVERDWRVDWSDRGILRPALSIRRASAAIRRAGLTIEAGKQFVRWGKVDVLIPTDRFAPRDFMEVVDNEFLGITAVRATWEHRSNTIDAVWGRFTPSRVPMLTDRWAAVPASFATAGPGASMPIIVDLGATYPTRPQAGLRWNHVAPGFEFSLSGYDGFNHLPNFEATTAAQGSSGVAQGSSPVTQGSSLAIFFSRSYPRMRMFGGDAAIPFRWFTLKGEAAYFASPDGQSDEYTLYVLQAERQTGEWFFVGGYAGEIVRKPFAPPPGSTVSGAFALDRGLAGSFLGRASYTIDVNRSVAFEGAVRQNGNGLWLKAEYSQAAGQHLRATLRGNLIRGDESDFLGKYRLNSNVAIVLRYSF